MSITEQDFESALSIAQEMLEAGSKHNMDIITLIKGSKQDKPFWYAHNKLWYILIWFYGLFCPLRLKWKIERKNWHPDNISFQDWYESSGYPDSDLVGVCSLAKWVDR